MPVQVVNPDGIHNTTTYFQASVSTGSKVICLSGQAAVDSNGRLVGAGDLAAQTEQAYRNIHAALTELGASFTDVARLTVYVVDWSSDKMPLLLAGVRSAAADLGFDHRRSMTLIGCTGLADPEWLVEVEAMAIVE